MQSWFSNVLHHSQTVEIKISSHAGSCFRQPFTDFLNSQDVSDVDAYTAGPVDLPQGYDEPDQLVQEDDPLGPQAVTAEIDNYLLDQSEQECKKDKLDFCVNDYDYRGPEHTMCTFCVSQNIQNILWTSISLVYPNLLLLSWPQL